MLKYYIKTSEAVRRLLTDKDGMVSFEYVVAAAVVVTAVAAAFTAKGTGIQDTLTNALTYISGQVTAAT
jgi:Flp pilus assembly pilin Flp